MPIRKRLMPLIVTASLLAAAMPGAAWAGPALPDVTGHWAENAIRGAAEAGWVNGYPDGSFRPEGSVTRAEFLKMLSQVRGTAPTGIGDQRLNKLYGHLAEQNHWAVTAGYIRSAVAQAVVDPADYAVTFTSVGQIDTWQLEPDRALSRSEATILLTRALGGKYEAELPHLYPGSQWAPAVDRPALSYADAGAIPEWSKGWVLSASKAGLITGYPDGSFRAGGSITRAEAVVILQRLSALDPQSPDLLARVRPPQTRALKVLEGLTVRDFQPVRILRFEAGDGEETSGVWANLPRTYREKVVREKTEQFWQEMQAKNVSPLVLDSVMVMVEGPWYFQFAYATYDGHTFQYFDGNGWPGQEDENSPIDLRTELVAKPDNLAAQMERYVENARTNLQAAGPVEPRKVYTFPYQYLGDWFQLNEVQVLAWGLEEARQYYASVKPPVEQLGGALGAVRIALSPSDTAGRLAQYRSLLPGRTLVDNPVLELVYDGQTLTVARRPATLSQWLGGLTPTYASERQGEGSGAPRVDPDPTTARQVMETLVYTLGTWSSGQ